eukprot:CAMPEP_0178899716 /NCGR_PEP_ID=MMETSP0786-20121207/3060_1 /TAXON_ID=186022 /ORGANISM="Thalassionema frauenfeldii, Strain CCMP 1798" /LENGTH=106 /DNA_ID=CAMNT_0020570615 /DNA_START=262 /DNA_END=582 /DNA_ORIENTATION=+
MMIVANYFDPIVDFNNQALDVLENNNNKSDIMVCCELLETAVTLTSKNNGDEESMNSSSVVSKEQRQDNEKVRAGCKKNADSKTFTFSKGLKILSRLDIHHNHLSN